MIRTITLENWRAYRNLTIDLGPGTTFLVAPNGIGKSSLVEAVRWGLCAEEMTPSSWMIRAGHDAASVRLVLDTSEGELAVSRSLRLSRSRLSSEVELTIDGEVENDRDRLWSLLGSELAADSRFVSRTAFLGEDLGSRDDEPDLRSHLCRAYSLDNLQAALALIDPALRDVNQGLRSTRAEVTATEAELEQARAEHDSLVAALRPIRDALAAARSEHSAIRSHLEAALATQERQQAAAAWDVEQARLLESVAPFVGQLAADAAIDEALVDAERSLGSQLEAVRNEQARLQATLESIASSLSTLHEAGAACPVCLRDLDDQSSEHAERLHQEAEESTRQQLALLDSSDVSARLESVRGLRREAAALGVRPQVDTVEDVQSLRASEGESQKRVEAGAAAVGELEIRTDRALEQADRLAAEIGERDDLARRYRNQAALEAAKKALTETMMSVLDRQLSPLTELVNRRWLAVFDRPLLALTPDGQISRQLDGAEDPLDFKAFSAGEKTVARLMMHVTTLLSTTRVPFCFIDEPLEHLDPQSRRLVGSTLAHLSSETGLRQIFVTTYEEPLARRLAELQPEQVRIQYLRAETVR